MSTRDCKRSKRLPELDPSRVRAEFEQRLTARHMAEDYVRHYHLLLETGPAERLFYKDMDASAMVTAPNTLSLPGGHPET